VLRVNLHDCESVNAVLVKFPDLDADRLIIDRLAELISNDFSCADRLTSLTHTIINYLPSFRSRAALLQFLIPACESVLEGIEVDSPSTERRLHATTSSLIRVLTSLGDSPDGCVRTLSDLVGESPCARFRICDTLAGFVSDRRGFAARMMDICALLGLTDLASRICSAFAIPPDHLRAIANHIQLGALDDLPPVSAPVPASSLRVPLLASPTLLALGRAFPPPADAPSLSFSQTFIHRYEPAEPVVTRVFPVATCAPFLAQRWHCQAALDLVRACGDAAVRPRLFRAVFESALEGGHFHRFKHFLMQADREGCEPFLRDLFERALLLHLRLELEQVLGRHEGAAATAIQLFREKRQSVRALLLDTAESVIVEELADRAGRRSSSRRPTTSCGISRASTSSGCSPCSSPSGASRGTAASSCCSRGSSSS
jgi:hypothetical protein